MRLSFLKKTALVIGLGLGLWGSAYADYHICDTSPLVRIIYPNCTGSLCKNGSITMFPADQQTVVSPANPVAQSTVSNHPTEVKLNFMYVGMGPIIFGAQDTQTVYDRCTMCQGNGVEYRFAIGTDSKSHKPQFQIFPRCFMGH